MEVHIHPDQKVIIRDNDENAVYVDTIANFELDYGQSLDLIPAPWTEVLYKQGIWKRYANKFTNETVVEAWTQGDDIIANKDALIAAKAVRDAAEEELPPE